MAVAPQFASHVFAAGSSKPHQAQHTFEFYVDYVCPFSAKIFKRLSEEVIPYFEQEKPGQVKFILRQLIQPWHPSSTLTHEAAVAVSRLSPDKFWDFSKALFEHQKEYFDVNVVNETRNQTYKRLAELAQSSVSLDADKVYELLVISDKPDGDSYNIGNKVTNDIKFMTKAARQASAHVTPTVYFNGVPDNNVSSGWTLEQWKEWGRKNVV